MIEKFLCRLDLRASDRRCQSRLFHQERQRRVITSISVGWGEVRDIVALGLFLADQPSSWALTGFLASFFWGFEILGFRNIGVSKCWGFTIVRLLTASPLTLTLSPVGRGDWGCALLFKN
jgi:hypothetical protein